MKGHEKGVYKKLNHTVRKQILSKELEDNHKFDLTTHLDLLPEKTLSKELWKRFVVILLMQFDQIESCRSVIRDMMTGSRRFHPSAAHTKRTKD